VSFDGFAIKVSSVDENDQSTAINAQPLNGFHASEGNRRKRGVLVPPLPSDSIDGDDSIAGFAEILDHPSGLESGASESLISSASPGGGVSPRSEPSQPMLSLVVRELPV
jgi:hypothetical protein